MSQSHQTVFSYHHPPPPFFHPSRSITHEHLLAGSSTACYDLKAKNIPILPGHILPNQPFPHVVKFNKFYYETVLLYYVLRQIGKTKITRLFALINDLSLPIILRVLVFFFIEWLCRIVCFTCRLTALVLK